MGPSAGCRWAWALRVSGFQGFEAVPGPTLVDLCALARLCGPGRARAGRPIVAGTAGLYKTGAAPVKLE